MSDMESYTCKLVRGFNTCTREGSDAAVLYYWILMLDASKIAYWCQIWNWPCLQLILTLHCSPLFPLPLMNDSGKVLLVLASVLPCQRQFPPYHQSSYILADKAECLDLQLCEFEMISLRDHEQQVLKTLFVAAAWLHLQSEAVWHSECGVNQPHELAMDWNQVLIV